MASINTRGPDRHKYNRAESIVGDALYVAHWLLVVDWHGARPTADRGRISHILYLPIGQRQLA
jgi:hypothetical protein